MLLEKRVTRQYIPLPEKESSKASLIIIHDIDIRLYLRLLFSLGNSTL